MKVFMRTYVLIIIVTAQVHDGCYSNQHKGGRRWVRNPGNGNDVMYQNHKYTIYYSVVIIIDAVNVLFSSSPPARSSHHRRHRSRFVIFQAIKVND